MEIVLIFGPPASVITDMDIGMFFQLAVGRHIRWDNIFYLFILFTFFSDCFIAAQ